MDDPNEIPAELRWAELEARLARYLATMTDVGEADHLILESDSGNDGLSGTTPYAQFASYGGGQMLRAELSGNAFLSEAYRLGLTSSQQLIDNSWRGNECDDELLPGEEPNWYREVGIGAAAGIAKSALSALREQFGIPHPELLTYRAWGPAAAGALELGLLASGDVPEEAALVGGHNLPPIVTSDLMERIVVVPEDRDQLVAFVGQALATKLGAAPQRDEDGDFVFTHLGQPVWVVVRQDQPAIEIMTRVVKNVYSRRAAAVEIGILNRDSAWTRWVLRDRGIWLNVMMPGLPFLPRFFGEMLDLFVETMSTRDDLAYRTGGRTGV